MTRQGAGLAALAVAGAVALAVFLTGQKQGSEAGPKGAEEVQASVVTEAAPTAVASAEAVAPAPVPPEPPRFDVVRVDGEGLATVALTAPAGSKVALRVDGAEVAQGLADTGGQFATLFTLAPSDAVRVLSLMAILADGTEVAGVETVALAPVAAPEVAVAEAQTPDPAPQPAPAALLILPEGVEVLQPPAAMDPPEAPVGLQIDAISYGAAGEVVIGGRGAPEALVRLYLDAVAAADVTTDKDGRWQVTLADVAAGLHVLRADQIDAAGKVLARFETPFQRDVPATEPVAEAAPVAEVKVDAEKVAVVQEPAPAPAEAPQSAAAPAADTAPVPAAAPITITVQPGLTLWAIARENFGDGVMYVQVFEANRDKIKDPDLIYPGQVFTVPKP